MKWIRNKIDGFILINFIVTCIEAVLALIALLLIPGDDQHSVLLGFSLARWALIVVQGAVSLMVLWGFWQIRRKSEEIFSGESFGMHKKKWLTFILTIVFFLTSTILLNPLYIWGKYKAYVERLQPLLAFIMLTSLHGWLILQYMRRRVHAENHSVEKKRKSQDLFTGGIFFIPLLGLWVFIVLTGIGVKGEWSLWNEAGVPILARQIWFCLWGVFGAQQLYRYLSRAYGKRRLVKRIEKRKDVIICLFLFGLAFALWTSVPSDHQFFSPGPYAPEYEPYPYADAARFDRHVQFAMIGQGFSNGRIGRDHIGYSGFLSLLHVLAGQDYSKLILLQLAVFSFYPIILYILGKNIKNRAMALFLAGISIFQQYNNIKAGTYLNTSHAGNFLSEFPTGMLLAVLFLLLFNWFNGSLRKKQVYAISVGAILGVLILLRFNTLMIPLLVFLLLIFIYGKQWKKWLRSILLVMLAIGIVLSPVMLAHGQRTGTYLFFLDKPISYLRRVIQNKQTSQQSIVVQDEVLMTRNESSVGMVAYYEPGVREESGRGAGTEGTLHGVASYFLHNLVTSVLILPNSIMFHDLDSVVFQNLPYWNKLGSAWQGEMETAEMIGLWANILIISFGLGFAVRKWKIAGLIPASLFLIYNLATALVGTAGGRYITVTVWILFLYYAIGIFEILERCGFIEEPMPLNVKIEEGGQRIHIARNLGILFVCLALPLFMVILDRITPARFETLTDAEVLERIDQLDLLSGGDGGLTMTALTAFIEDGGGSAYWGAGLYPRYYPAGAGEHSAAVDAYQVMEFDRLAFTLIGPFGTKDVILPLHDTPLFFPNGADVYVLGCESSWKTENGFALDAVMLIVVDEKSGKTVIYQRDPQEDYDCREIEQDMLLLDRLNT